MTSGLALEDDRVRHNTAAPVNRRIDAATLRNIRRYARQPRHILERRIRELNEEWDIERVLETNASILALGGVLLAAAGSRRWLLVSGTVLGFLLLHGLQGWCPPVPLFRRAGIRTRSEIDREKLALKYLRGDFGDEPPPRPVDRPARERRRLGALVEEGIPGPTGF